MAFLKKTMLAKMAGEATAEKHPMLEKHDVPRNVKTAYLQGCVLAGVLKDGVLSEAKKADVLRLGASLQLAESEIVECISLVSGLATDEAKEQFVGEILAVLSGDTYPKYFLKDFEELLMEDGKLSDDMADYLDYFGSTLCYDKNWRKIVSDSTPSVVGKQGIWGHWGRHLDYNPNDWLYAEIRDVVCAKLHLDVGRVTPETPFSELQIEPFDLEELRRTLCNKYKTSIDLASSILEWNCVGTVYNDILWRMGSNYVEAGPYNRQDSFDNHANGGYFILPGRCVCCGCCTEVCPEGAILEGSPYWIIPNMCVDCGECASTCPNEAIIFR